MSSLSAQSSPAPVTSDEISILELLTPFMRRWRMIVFVPLLFGVAAVVIALLLPPKYTAVTTFTEETNGSSALPGGLAGLVGLAGDLGVGGLAGGNLSPDFLASILKSRELLDSTLSTSFGDPDRPAARRTLLDILEVDGDTRRERMSNGVRQLSHAATPSVDPNTGIVTLSVELRDPELAAAVATRMAELLDRFNTEQRQTQSRLEREFVRGRLTQAEKELHAAEQEQVHFLQANRQYQQSPLLAVEASRLERQVQTKQEVFLTLTKAYEQARIAEVRNTPSITIIDSAVPPARRSSPHRLLIVVLGFFIGALVAGAAAYLLELQRSIRRNGRPGSLDTDAPWHPAREELVTSSTGEAGQ